MRHRLYLFVGGFIVIALFAALIVPWFINWDNYRINFEHEAARILGHPVHVGGFANASILPSPSLTFTDVTVGEEGAEPMMTVERFEVTIELLPLMQGEFRVVAMKLDKPKVRVAADDAGVVDWLVRSSPAQQIDPDKVVLGSVQISDGTFTYNDARTGVGLSFAGVNATVEALSLAGPWRAEGSYKVGEEASHFSFATGRQLEDGSIRVKTDFSPPQWPFDVTADGVLANKPETGITYTGTYAVTEVLDGQGAKPAEGSEAPASAGWRSEGAFALARDRIVIDKAILSNGPLERPTSVAGSLTVLFGATPSFEAVAEARQLDLDSSLGGGPTAPVNVAAAANGFVAWLTQLPIPPMPGRIAFNVPGIVVGGSVIQDVAFVAAPAAAGWQIDGFHARLPGQAAISADGVLTTDRVVGFVGSARLAVAQPATFAAWWRGGGQAGLGRLLSAFDISGETEIAPGRISVDKINARIGDATITGRFAWSEAERDHHRHLGTDLKADRIDFAQVKALADLLVGRNLTDTAGLADSFSIRLAADAFQYEDIHMTGVAVDAAYSDDVLTVVQLAVADVGGASFRVTSGRMEDLTTGARGHLDARLEATAVDGLAHVAGKFAPGTGLVEWLTRTAPVLTPAVVTMRLTAQPKGGTGLQLALEGVAGPTTFSATFDTAATLDSAGNVPAWRSAAANVKVALDSPDSAGLARQLGLAASPIKDDGGAHVAINGTGVPKDGIDATIDTEFAGLAAKAKGKLTLAADVGPAFAGALSLTAEDLAPFVAAAGLAIPGNAGGTPVGIDGTIATAGTQATLAWQNGTIADRVVSGTAKLARQPDLTWRVEGDLAVDAVDLGWLASLSLGFAPEPTGDAKTPWSKAPFGPPTYGQVSGKLTVATEHLSVGEGLDVTGGKLALTLQPNRIDVDLKDGHIAGGGASGGVSIQNVEGSANLTGQFNLTGAALESFVWQRQGRVVATGVLDLSANFEATGRTPAGLVSSMTGGGVIGVRNGVARYVNPETARAIVRVSDLGDPFTDEALRAAIEEQIDADSFAFAETGGAFAIAAGTVRMSGLAARGSGVEATGNAVIDLNAMTLDSDWTLGFSAGDAATDAGNAKVGVVFRGPLAAPARIIDALPFNSYLNTRQAARMLDIIATEEADRAERQRLLQRLAKIRDDDARLERIRQQSLDAERRRSEVVEKVRTALAALHVEREAQADERAAAALVRGVERTAAAAAAAEAKAVAATARAADSRAKADAAASALAAAIAADDAASAAAASLGTQRAAAEASAKATAEKVVISATAAEAAQAKAMAAIDAETAAKQAEATAASGAATAKVILDGATARATATATAAETATAADATAKASLAAADKAVGDAVSARDAAAAAFAAAVAALDAIKAEAAEKAIVASAAEQRADEAAAERAQLELTANAALFAQQTAEADRDAARRALDAAQREQESAAADLASSQPTDLAGTDVQIAAKRAKADEAKRTLKIATDAYQAAEMKASSTAATASRAQAAAAAATSKALTAATAAAAATAASLASQALLAERTKARDDAAKAVEATKEAAQRAGAAFDVAQGEAIAAADRLVAAKAAAETAAEEQTAATNASAASGAGGPAFALHEATAARASTATDAANARATADAARAAALAAADALAAIASTHDAAVAAASVAHAGRIANERAAESAGSQAAQAEAEAAAAEAEAKTLAEEARLAAARVPPQAPVAAAVSTGDATSDAPMPLPRQRQKPLSIVPQLPDALAGDAPLAILPTP